MIGFIPCGLTEQDIYDNLKLTNLWKGKLEYRQIALKISKVVICPTPIGKSLFN